MSLRHRFRRKQTFFHVSSFPPFLCQTIQGLVLLSYRHRFCCRDFRRSASQRPSPGSLPTGNVCPHPRDLRHRLIAWQATFVRALVTCVTGFRDIRRVAMQAWPSGSLLGKQCLFAKKSPLTRSGQCTSDINPLIVRQLLAQAGTFRLTGVAVASSILCISTTLS